MSNTTTTPPKPHITQLREDLLATLADLRNRDAPMDPDRARAVAQVAAVLIDSAKVENDYIKLTGQDRSEFMEAVLPALVHNNPSAHNPFPVSARNRLQG